MNSMIRGHRIGPLPVLAVVALASSLASCSSSASDGAKNSPSSKPTAVFAVMSTLVDGSTLTKPTRWEAKTGAGNVDHVDFLIDNKVIWTEVNVPYFFNDDGNVLAPWLLSPGKHVLTARATTTDGSSAEAVATVQIGPVPSVPAGLDGTFIRTVTQRDIDRTANNPGRDPETLPTGRWTAHLAKGLLTFDDPRGSGGAEAYSATAGQLKMWGTPNWLLPKARQGSFCEAEPAGTFHWSRKGDQLIITGGGNCADRDALFIGSWKKQS